MNPLLCLQWIFSLQWSLTTEPLLKMESSPIDRGTTAFDGRHIHKEIGSRVPSPQVKRGNDRRFTNCSLLSALTGTTSCFFQPAKHAD